MLQRKNQLPEEEIQREIMEEYHLTEEEVKVILSELYLSNKPGGSNPSGFSIGKRQYLRQKFLYAL